MFGFIKKLFGSKAETQAECPYKVETAPVVEAAPAPVAEVKAEPKKTAPAKKPAAKKQQFAKKPAAPKAGGAKKGPKKPKAKPAA